MKKYLSGLVGLVMMGMMVLGMLLMVGCVSTQKAPVGPAKKVFLKPFNNNTVQYALHGILTDYVKEEFLRESSIKVVGEADAEYIVSGTVTKYELKPTSYTMANKAEGYDMKITVNVFMKNIVDDTMVWQKDMTGEEIYFTSDGNPGETRSNTELEQDSQKRALDYLARDISRQVVYAKE